MLSSFEQSNLHGSSLAQQAISSQTIDTNPTPRAESTLQVLILAPHPDDESLGCGGTLKQLTDSGVAVDVAFMTRGELGGRRGVVIPPLDQLVLATQRVQEAVQACRILGIRNVHFLSGRDGDLSKQPELSAEILQLLKSRNYCTVFCPWAFDFHPDHSATFDHLVAALRNYQRDPEVWLYEVWSTLHPNRIVSIDGTIESKMQAVHAHASQMKNYEYDYSDCFRALARYRGMLAPGMRHAEAFYVCSREVALGLRTAGPSVIPQRGRIEPMAEVALAS